jgi:hypothetical protein
MGDAAPEAARSDVAGRLFSPSAARNQAPIAEVVERHAPPAGLAFEIASGTGQHVVNLAQRLPQLTWQPSEVEEARLRSIRARIEETGLTNVRPPIRFDAISDPWPTAESGGWPDVVLLVNLLHLLPEKAARRIFDRAAGALRSPGLFLLYGPFLREGTYASEGDARFDQQLRSQTPAAGYRDVTQIAQWAADARLTEVERVEMPANNLMWVLRRG